MRVLVLVLLGFILGAHGEAVAQELALERATHEAVLKAIQESPARLTVVNFWATWCGPCRQEFPHFVEAEQELASRGVDVIFVSADFEEDYAAAEAYLRDQGVQGVSYLKKGPDAAFIEAFSSDWTGALPTTFFYGEGGTLLAYHEGAFAREDLRARIDHYLDDATTNQP